MRGYGDLHARLNVPQSEWDALDRIGIQLAEEFDDLDAMFNDIQQGHRDLEDDYCPLYAFGDAVSGKAICIFIGLVDDTPYEDLIADCN